MEYTGIWMDKRKAMIISIENGKEKLHTISSDIEDFNIHGGSGTRVKGGPQDVVQDSKYMEREKHQMKLYFNNIISSIGNTDEIVVFGPAQMGSVFSKDLSENYSKLYDKVKGVEKTDNMTENQLKAWVKEYFEIS